MSFLPISRTAQPLLLIAGAATIAAVPASAVVLDPATYYQSTGGYSRLVTDHTIGDAVRSDSDGSILGGERDIAIDITEVDGPYIQIQAGGGPDAYGVYRHFWALNQSGIATVTLQYDGLDNSPDRASGWGLDLAALGSSFLVPRTEQYLAPFGETEQVVWPLTMTVADGAGNVSSVSKNMAIPTRYNPGIDLSFSFSDFEIANTALNLNDIDVIEISGELNSQNPATQWIYFGALSIEGPAYDATGGSGSGGDDGGTPGGAVGQVPAPPMLGLLGAGLAGLGLRRRRAR